MDKTEKVKLPFVGKELAEYFKERQSDPEKIYIVDYKKTLEKMSHKAMLVYIANLEIRCVFDEIDAKLLIEYIKFKSEEKIVGLNEVFANIILRKKYGKFSHLFVTINEELYNEVINDVEEHIDNVIRLLNSSFLFAIYASNTNPDIITDKIDKSNFDLGYTFLRLFELDIFLTEFLQLCPALTDQKFYTNYFDNKEFPFNGKNYYEKFFNPNNVYAGFVNACLGIETEEKMEGLIEKMKDIVNEKDTDSSR